MFGSAAPSENTSRHSGVTLSEALEREDWEAVLVLLRDGSLFLPRHTTAFLRGKAYEALGHGEAAVLFFSFAARTDPQYQDLPALLRAA